MFLGNEHSCITRFYVVVFEKMYNMEHSKLSELNKELHMKLRQKYPELVLGAGIRTIATPIICIYLRREPEEEIRKDITKDYEGCKVEIEVTGTISIM